MKTDSQLQRDVIAELNWEPSVDARQIGVEVSEGVVNLSGHVHSFAEKWNAEQAAQRVAGVRALAVDITVVLPGTSKRGDADIARAAENLLQWSSYLPNDSVKVLVENGWITLTGEVDWEYQKQAATRDVRNLMGVRGVSDQISINPKVSSEGIKADIEAALKRRAKTEAETISVEVHGDHVTLSGSVYSWPDRKLACHSAWGTPGVRAVTDNITVI